MTAKSGKRITFLLCACLCLSSLGAQQVQVTAGFEPNILTVGEHGKYVMTLHNIQANVRWQVPMPPEVIVLSNASMQSFEWSNGLQAKVTKKVLTVFATGPGLYTVPSHEIELNGDTYIVPSASLKVVERTTPQAARQTESSSSNGKTDQSVGSGGPMIELVKPRERLYVGESAFSQIKIYVPEPVRWRSPVSLPSKEGDAFSVTGLNQVPRVGEVQLGEKHYRVMSFPALVTPLKSGEQMLNFDYQLVTVEPMRGSRGFTDPFGD